jgi:hypothetical protein
VVLSQSSQCCQQQLFSLVRVPFDGEQRCQTRGCELDQRTRPSS